MTWIEGTKFWMVYVEGGPAPTHKHTTEESAMHEAERLVALAGPDARAYVLEATLCATPERPPVAWEKLTTTA